MSNDMKIRDRGLARVFENINTENITKNDVQNLLESANDRRKVTDLEKNELNWILYRYQNNFTPEAKNELAQALGIRENNIPMPSLYIRDRSLRRAMANALSDNEVSKQDIQGLLDAAKDGGRVTTREKAEMNMILNRMGGDMNVEARGKLAEALGVTLQPAPQPLKDVSVLRGNTYAIKDLDSFNETFRKDLEAAKADLVGHPSLSDDQKAERMFEFFKPYGARFHTLAQNASTAKTKAATADVQKTLKDVGFSAVLDKDTDKDGLTLATEVMRGTDPDRYSMIADNKVWSTTYWPMAGDAGDIDGDASEHLWAKDGALDKLDNLNRARGNDSGAKALEFERKPALNWLIGRDMDKGHYIPDSDLSEANAEVTTGVDFNGDGKITEGVKVDFLDAQGGFAAVGSNRDFVAKLGDETLTTKTHFPQDGSKPVLKYYRNDGSEVTGTDFKNIEFTNPKSDGKTKGSLDVGWWGSCDKVALAGILFEEPRKDVTVDGVTFTTQDIKGLLTVLADSQAAGTDFVGSRFDDRPDILVTNDGKQISGKLQDDVEFQTNDMWRWNGDYMVLNGHDKDIKFKDYATGEITTVKASDIKYLAREDEKDMNAAEFHDTIQEWLGSGRSAAMDRDSGDHVWNYSFWKAERAEVDPPSTANIEKLRGYKGEIKNPDNVKFYESDLYFGESNWPKEYKYWVETDNNGKVINSGWQGDNPDFLWRPKGFNNWSGRNDRNPYVDPALVKEIYMKSIE